MANRYISSGLNRKSISFNTLSDVIAYVTNMAAIERAKIVLGSRRGGYLLHYGGFSYARNRARESKIYWRCNSASCGVFLQTEMVNMQVDAEVAVSKEPSRPHRHEPAGDVYCERVRLLRQMTSVVEVCKVQHTVVYNIYSFLCVSIAVF